MKYWGQWWNRGIAGLEPMPCWGIRADCFGSTSQWSQGELGSQCGQMDVRNTAVRTNRPSHVISVDCHIEWFCFEVLIGAWKGNLRIHSWQLCSCHPHSKRFCILILILNVQDKLLYYRSPQIPHFPLTECRLPISYLGCRPPPLLRPIVALPHGQPPPHSPPPHKLLQPLMLLQTFPNRRHPKEISSDWHNLFLLFSLEAEAPVPHRLHVLHPVVAANQLDGPDKEKQAIFSRLLLLLLLLVSHHFVNQEWFLVFQGAQQVNKDH